MPIESIRNSQTCKFCNKEYVNLAMHIIKSHPSIVDQLEEREPLTSQNAPISSINPTVPQQSRGVSDINAMIREKLDTMLNIKIIEMLSKHPDTSIVDIQKALNPQANTTLQDIKAYHDMVYGDREAQPNINIGGESGGWLELATAAIPIIAQILPQKKAEIEKHDTEHTGVKERSIGVRRLIPQEIAANRGEPSNTSGESSIIDAAKQSDSGIANTTNKGA